MSVSRAASLPNRVFIYLDTPPQTTGSGAHLRLYSNVRAYLDLGFDVEVVHFTANPEGSAPGPGLEGLRWSRAVAGPTTSSLLGRLEFRAGIPGTHACQYYCRWHTAVCAEARWRARQHPGALHQFEGDSTGNAIPFLKNVNAIWGAHDIGSETVAAVQRIAREIEPRSASRPEKREFRFQRKFERRIARHSRLVLCISEHDCGVMRAEWKCPQAEYLPMSIPGEEFRVQRHWLSSGGLSLIHVGALAHLPAYRSLEFLLDRVIPFLAPDLLNRITLRLAGRVDPDNACCRRILSLASRYPQVTVLGYVEDLHSLYSQSDAQIVLSTEATGLRTRIIESFACGLPVLSSSTAARGIPGLRSEENIVLADAPDEVAAALRSMLQPSRLEALARNARQSYETLHSRRVVAAALASFLSKYFSRASVQGIGSFGALAGY